MREGGGRCRMHGGASLRGRKHPRYSHGLYSKYSAAGREHRAGIERRKRERAQRREDRYVRRRLFTWLERAGEHYDVRKALALADAWRREYRGKAGLPLPRGPEPLSPAERERRRRARLKDGQRRVEESIKAAVREGLGLPLRPPANSVVEGLRKALGYRR